MNVCINLIVMALAAYLTQPVIHLTLSWRAHIVFRVSNAVHPTKEACGWMRKRQDMKLVLPSWALGWGIGRQVLLTNRNQNPEKSGCACLWPCDVQENPSSINIMQIESALFLSFWQMPEAISLKEQGLISETRVYAYLFSCLCFRASGNTR